MWNHFFPFLIIHCRDEENIKIFEQQFILCINNLAELINKRILNVRNRMAKTSLIWIFQFYFSRLSTPTRDVLSSPEFIFC